MIKVSLEGDWAGAGKTLARAAARLPSALRSAVDGEAEQLREEMVKTIAEGVAPSLSPLSAALGRGGGPPLAGLAKDVVVQQLGGGGVFVGIRPGRRAELAQIHAEGRSFTVTMTAKQRAFIMAKLREAGLAAARQRGAPRTPSSGGGVIHITIPARPFAQKVLEKPAEVGARVRDRIARELKGDLGT